MAAFPFACPAGSRLSFPVSSGRAAAFGSLVDSCPVWPGRCSSPFATSGCPVGRSSSSLACPEDVEASFDLPVGSCPTGSGSFSSPRRICSQSRTLVPVEVSAGTLAGTVPSSGFSAASRSPASGSVGGDSGRITTSGSSLVGFDSFGLSEITLTATCSPESEPRRNGESAAWPAPPSDASSPRKSSRVCVYMF